MEDYLEQWSEKYGEEDIGNLIESFSCYKQDPIDLNDTNSNELLNLYFITDRHQKALKEYIIQNGYLASIYELSAINGFDKDLIQFIKPYVYAGTPTTKNIHIKGMLFKGRHFFTTGSKTIFEKQKGYDRTKDNLYTGAGFRRYFKYQYEVKDKLSLGILGENDAGERFRLGNGYYGFDFLGAYALIKKWGKIEKIIVGNYHLQFGQGLTLWTGGGFSFPIGVHVRKNPSDIKPASTFAEYGQMRGAAVSIKPFSFMSFTFYYSNIGRDARIKQIDEKDNIIEFQTMLKTGYHRTEKEMENRKNITEILYGTHLNYTLFSNLQIGYTFFATKYSALWIPTEQPYQYYSFKGDKNVTTGLDINYVLQNHYFFGELSVSKNRAIAGMFGLESLLFNELLFSGYYRNYSPDYHSPYSQGLGQNSQNQNEQGVYLALEAGLPFDIKFSGNLDLYTFPWLKYQVNSPAYGNEIAIAMSKPLSAIVDLFFQFRYKTKFQNASIDTMFIVYPEQKIKNTINTGVQFKPTNQLQFTTKAACTVSISETEKKQYGFVGMQDLHFFIEKPALQCSFRYAYFQADYWENRMYFYEKDLDFEFSAPVYYGRGSQLYVCTYWKIQSNIKIGIRYSMWYYPEKEVIGSGSEEISGNRKQELKAQIQLRW